MVRASRNVRRIAFVALAAASGCGLDVVGTFGAGPDAGGEAGVPTDGGGPSADTAPGDGGAPDASCDAALASDPANCGSCGHDCAGGACSGGRCQPVALLDLPGHVIRAVTADAKYLYWADNTANTIMRGDFDAGDSGVFLAAGAGELAVDATNFYYTANGNLHRVAMGTKADQSIAAFDGCIGLAPEGVIAYGTHFGASEVLRVTLPDGVGGPTTLLTASDGVFKPWGVAANATDLYWTNGGHTYPDGSIMRRPRAGGVPTAVKLHQANPNCLAFDEDGFLYWPNADDGTIHRVNPDGTNDQTLATGLDTPTEIAITPKFLYWNDGSKLARLAR